MHTVEDAAGLRCPVMTTDTIASRECIGDRCMMWRWGREYDSGWERPKTPPMKFAPPPLVRSNKGYCGMGGAPYDSVPPRHP